MRPLLWNKTAAVDFQHTLQCLTNKGRTKIKTGRSSLGYNGMNGQTADFRHLSEPDLTPWAFQIPRYSDVGITRAIPCTVVTF